MEPGFAVIILAGIYSDASPPVETCFFSRDFNWCQGTDLILVISCRQIKQILAIKENEKAVEDNI